MTPEMTSGEHDALRQRLQAALGDSLVLERELGGGGMSVVFVAHEPALARRVAVKVLAPALGAAVDAERFRREILLAARLQHPHVVPVLRAGEADGVPYFVMPYVQGESLRKRLERTGPLPVVEAVRLLRAVAAALAYAHGHGVVHRDVKPDNVLLSAGGLAVVTDFGVARALTAAARHGSGDARTTLTGVGLAVGTPAYMAPEQAAADPTMDHRVDLYAFGVLAYEVLTGDTLFPGRSGAALLAAHATEAPSPIQRRRPDLPPSLAGLVMRCVEKRPDARPSSADFVVAQLDQLLLRGGGMDVARDEPRPAERGMRRWPLAAAAALVVGAVAIGVAVLDARDGAGGAAGEARRLVLLTGFAAPGADTLLGAVLAEAVRTDLVGERRVALVPNALTERSLQARCMAPTVVLDQQLARDVAAEAGASAVVDGSVTPVGSSYLLTVRLVEPGSGRILAAHRETATSLDAVMPAVDRLSDRLLDDVRGALPGLPAAAPLGVAGVTCGS
ncbi:MAG TPA: serine/threonine-protein kinase [Gemmatimonadales bacterium]